MPGQSVLVPAGPGRLIVKPLDPPILVKKVWGIERLECNSGHAVPDYKFNIGNKFRVLS